LILALKIAIKANPGYFQKARIAFRITFIQKTLTDNILKTIEREGIKKCAK